ncbi:MAG: haloacid dehalogenase family protein [uncultured archaeon A07HB70]|nr:MAG: haloacid dehalogenase family protein [uncultured archaeon A07HB70]
MSPSGSEADRPALLFDMDGVILTGRGNDPVVHERALADTLADYGLTVPKPRRAALSGYEYTEAFVDACHAVGVAPEPFYTAREIHSARRIADRLEAGVRGVAPDVDALATLADDYELALVSNNYNRAVETAVDHHGLDVFAVARGREPGVTGFGRRKPDPYYLRETLDRLDADAGLYVGDRETDLLAADRAGLDGVFLRREHNAEAELETEPAAVIDSLAEVETLLDA